MNSSLRLAIFDADGTLLDSMGMWDTLDDAFLGRRGIASDPQVNRELHTMHFSESPAYFRRRFGIAGTDEEILQEFRDMANARYEQDIPAKDGASALLRHMRRAGFHMCVATASERDAIQSALARLGMMQDIEFILTCDDVGAGKSSPRLFEECARRLGGTPAETVVFEDSFYALQTAAQAGFHTVGVFDASVAEEEQRKLQQTAGRYVFSLRELLPKEEQTMIQQVMTSPGVIEFNEVPVPEVGDNDVLIRIHRIGVCGSDIHVYHGQHPFTSYPVTQGHEVSGEVVSFGRQVSGLRPGQRVTIQPQVFCGKCYPCTHGKYNLCESLKVMGFQTTGTASELFAVDASKVTPLPEGMSYDEGAMIEPLAVAVHAVRRMGDVTGLRVAVLGAGPIGNLVAQTAKGLGAAKVMITDISDLRLAKAKECGVDVCVNTRAKDFGEALVEAFGPDKADVIYDCAGNDVTINQAIRCARKGSTIILVAVFAKMATVDLAVLNDHELDLNTSMMYRNEDYLEAIRLVNEGKIHLASLISKHFAFHDYLEAYHYIDANREQTMKVIIDVDR